MIVEGDIHTTQFSVETVEKYSKVMPSFFRHNADYDKTVQFNRMHELFSPERKQFVVMGDAYFSSAYYLVYHYLNDSQVLKPVLWIFPILFDVVHGIEVYLKAINVSLNIALDKSHTNIEGNHDIRELCYTAKALIIEYKTLNVNETTKQMYTAIKVVKNFIANIYEKTHIMTFPRYPIVKDKDSKFCIRDLQEEVIVNAVRSLLGWAVRYE